MMPRIIAKIKNDHLKELLKGSSTAFTLKIAGLFFGYIFTLLIARIYGADTLGVFALSVTILTVFSVVGRLGFDTGLVRFIAEYSSQDKPESIKEVYLKSLKIAIPVCILLSFLLYLSAPLLAKQVFHKEHLAMYFKISSFALLPLVLIVLHSASLRGLKKIKEYSILQDVATSVLSMILLCLSIIFIRDEHAPLLAYVISLIIVCAYSLKLWFKHADIKSYAHGSRVKFKNMLNVSLPMLLSSSSFLVLEWTDTIMLGMYRTAEEVGVYSVAMKVAILTFIMLYAINSIAAPKFAEIYGKGDKKDFELIVKQSTKLIFWSSLPIILSIFLFPSFILGIFGQQFTIGVHALLILTFGQFIRAISGSVGYILQMTGRQRIFQNILISGAVINIGLNALLIPRYGINGAAIASTISTIFWNLTSVLFIKFHLNITTIYLPGLGKVGAK